MTNLLTSLAQATPTTQPTGPGSFLTNIIPLFLIIAVFWWWMSRSRSKERQRFQQMVDSLKRNDRVQTIGGIVATVVELRGNEVILKVDETSNVKMRFNRSAIKEVIRDTSNGG